jgi:hypothetical protein
MAALKTLVPPPAETVVLEAEEALMSGQLMAREVLQALLDKVMLVAAEFTLHLITAEAEAEVLELLVQVARVLLAVMAVTG